MNEITVQQDSYYTLVMLEVLTPFYMFQVVSLVLWFVEIYLYYAFAIIVMSLYGIILTVNQIREVRTNFIPISEWQFRGSVIL